MPPLKTPPLKTLVFGAAILALVSFVAVELLVEDEPEVAIEKRLEYSVGRFNDRDVRDVMRLFDEDYRDESGSYERSDVREGLTAMLWFGGRRFEAELRKEQLDIDVAEDGESATVALGLAIWLGSKDEGAPWWDLHAVTEFRKRGRRWRMVSSRDVNHHERGR